MNRKLQELKTVLMAAKNRMFTIHQPCYFMVNFFGELEKHTAFLKCKD